MSQRTIYDLISAEARARGLPTVLNLGKNPNVPLKNMGIRRSGKETMMLLWAEGWATYSRSWMSSMGWHGVHKSLSILGGIGPEGPWAVRIPGTITDIDRAIAWLQPAAVVNARAKGRQVLRQGDVWIVERGRPSAGDQISHLPSSHTWDPETRVLTHETHAKLHVPFVFVAVVQRTLPANGIGRRQGD